MEKKMKFKVKTYGDKLGPLIMPGDLAEAVIALLQAYPHPGQEPLIVSAAANSRIAKAIQDHRRDRAAAQALLIGLSKTTVLQEVKS